VLAAAEEQEAEQAERRADHDSGRHPRWQFGPVADRAGAARRRVEVLVAGSTERAAIAVGALAFRPDARVHVARVIARVLDIARANVSRDGRNPPPAPGERQLLERDALLATLCALAALDALAPEVARRLLQIEARLANEQVIV